MKKLITLSLFNLVIYWSSLSQDYNQNDTEIIEVGKENTQFEIQFSKIETSFILNNKAKGNLTTFKEAIETKGVKCCSPIKKLSKCIWSCCDEKTVNTCQASDVMQGAIELYFSILRDSTTKTNKPNEDH